MDIIFTLELEQDSPTAEETNAAIPAAVSSTLAATSEGDNNEGYVTSSIADDDYEFESGWRMYWKRGMIAVFMDMMS